jgi:hypothetical protein
MVIVVIFLGRDLNTNYSAPPKENWREVTAYVLSHSSPHDALIFHRYSGRVAFDYYIQLQGHGEPLGKVVFPKSINPSSVPVLDASIYGQMGQNYDKIWLIESHVRGEVRKRSVESMQESLRSQCCSESE